MASPAQIDANRLNAQKSTGPKSDEGKTASSANALKHGLTATRVFPAARQEDFDALARQYNDQYSPLGVEEEFHVQTMVHAAWNLRRYSQLHEDVWETLMQQEGVTSMAQAFVADSNGPKVIDKLFRYVGSLERSYQRAQRALVAEQQRRAEAIVQAQAQQRLAEMKERNYNRRLGEQTIGFVSSPTPSPMAATPAAPVSRSENLALRL